MNRRDAMYRLGVVKQGLRWWDPIGVVEDPNEATGLADDEYDSYAPGVFHTLEQGQDAMGVARHLASIRATVMTLGQPRPSEREIDVATKLVMWRDRGFGAAPDFRLGHPGYLDGEAG